MIGFPIVEFFQSQRLKREYDRQFKETMSARTDYEKKAQELSRLINRLVNQKGKPLSVAQVVNNKEVLKTFLSAYAKKEEAN